MSEPLQRSPKRIAPNQHSGHAASPLKVSSPMAPVTPQACTPSPPHFLPNPPSDVRVLPHPAPAKWADRFWAWVSPPPDVANRQETEMDPSRDGTVTARSSAPFTSRNRFDEFSHLPGGDTPMPEEDHTTPEGASCSTQQREYNTPNMCTALPIIRIWCHQHS